MKKYISPETTVVALHANRAVLQAASEDLGIYTTEITNEGEILTKSIISDKHVWDEEW